MRLSYLSPLLLCLIALVFVPQAEAFGAGNIASIAKIEGHNWRHGDIEDTLKGLAHLRGYKWSGANIKRVYFGNWLRDYSQAVDVGTLKGVPSDTIRLLLWVLAFMTFGYATAEFEVTSERLGCYRPEEHIDNPKGYADGEDARKYDPRLRGPVSQDELAIDPQSGMKNYIANERGNWATSLGYVKFSLTRAIHFGRVFKHGGGTEADLFEAFRCLGQGLHCLEDFGAHSNYVELALIEQGYDNVFAHVGVDTRINLHGKHVYPLVTGTFGGVDFLHSVLGEATDHVTQSEVDELDKALSDASSPTSRGAPGTAQQASGLIDLMSKVPGTGDLCSQARNLQSDSQAQANLNNNQGQSSRAAFPNASSVQTINAQEIIAKIYPIMVFRDNVVRTISTIVSHIPGLESLIDKISEKVTLFVMSLLAPYIIPVIKIASQQLKTGSSEVIAASANHQYEVWTSPLSTDPTHSMLSKDHFSNILNEPAGQVAASILQHVAPRIVEAWENPNIPVERVLNDAVGPVFHHPAARNGNIEFHRKMFDIVQRWARSMPDGGARLNKLLSSESVKNGGNHKGGAGPGHGGSVPAPLPHVPVPHIPGFRGIDEQDQGGMGIRQPPPEQNFGGGYGQPQQQQQGGQYGGYDQYNPPPPGGPGQFPPFAAGPRPNDSMAYPTAYSQGYEMGSPALPQQQQQGRDDYWQAQQGQDDYVPPQGPPPGYGGQQGQDEFVPPPGAPPGYGGDQQGYGGQHRQGSQQGYGGQQGYGNQQNYEGGQW